MGNKSIEEQTTDNQITNNNNIMEHKTTIGNHTIDHNRKSMGNGNIMDNKIMNIINKIMDTSIKIMDRNHIIENKEIIKEVYSNKKENIE